MRRLGVVLLPCMLMVFGAWCDDQGHHHELSEREVGSVHFLTSCSKDVETDFNRSVALLHSFQYEEARHAFEAVVAREPRCAMARWGVAMTHYHGLWENGDAVARREALRKAKEVAAANPRTTAREVRTSLLWTRSTAKAARTHTQTAWRSSGRWQRCRQPTRGK